jgi:hypothetical protein
MTAPDQFLAASRREFAIAKRWKARQWRIDVAASLTVLAAAAVPSSNLSLALALLAAAAKVGSRYAQGRSRSCFRVAERARRYDFQRRALGWELPHDEYADLVLSLSRETRSLPTEDIAFLQASYFEHDGSTPGVERLRANLHESVFWSKRLFAEMAKRRGRHMLLASAAVIVAVVVALFVPSRDGRMIVARIVALTVTFLVSLDVFGEWSAFKRCRSELSIVEKVFIELGTREATMEQVLRFLVDYSCLLVEAPMVPDSVYEELQPHLQQLWTFGRHPRQGRSRGSPASQSS